jgi:hypothetical protein
VDLPANLIYKKISDDIRPLWLSVVSAYCVANTYEAKKKENLLDISHGLRYAAGHIMAYATIREFGLEKANDIMGDVWQHIFENLDEYKTEHLCQKD